MKKGKAKKVKDEFTDSLLFTQPAFQKAIKGQKATDFDIEKIFDHNFKPGKELEVSKPDKKTKKSILKNSLAVFGKKKRDY